jgi:aspartate kinase
MRIYKFGGASVKNAEAVENLCRIMQGETQPVIIVVSAMGKTTNTMEKIAEAYFTGKTGLVFERIEYLKLLHYRIFSALIKTNYAEKKIIIDQTFNKLENILKEKSDINYDFQYDRIVPYGEILSTQIIHMALTEHGIANKWQDIRKILRTDDRHRSANIQWDISQQLFDEHINHPREHIITQGFIGSTQQGNTTTLGREGSDYTASALGFLANAEEVVIWKDVEGIMNADPKMFPNTQKLPVISYQEAVELAFYGAKVIHPKTIQPLQNKNIPLVVKSFLNPQEQGSVITDLTEHIHIPPVYIFKDNQYLISISRRDFSFIMEKEISEIYSIFDQHRARVNLSQNSAISYSASVNCDERRIQNLITELRKHYKVLYNEQLQLITIRHYTESCIHEILKNKEVLLEQRSRRTARFVVRDLI